MAVTSTQFELTSPKDRFRKREAVIPAGKFTEEPEFSGVVQNLTYRDDESGFFIANVRHESGVVRALTGFILAICPGEHVTAQGEWVTSPYGRQFKAKKVTCRLPDDLMSIETYLSHAIKGVGKTAAKHLVQKFGTGVFDAIASGPDALKGVKLIGPKRAKAICEAYHAQVSSQAALLFLFGMGVTPGRANKAIQHFGVDKLIPILTANPYRLQEISGIGFPLADAAAQRAGIPKTSAFRLRAGIGHVLRTVESEGACGCPVPRMRETAKVLLDVDDQLIESTIAELLQEKELVEAQSDGETVLYLRRTYQAERDVARMLLQIANRRLNPIPEPEALIRRIEGEMKLDLDEVQRQAVLTCLTSGVTVVTGGPGTGKTTATRVTIAALKAAGLTVRLMAPSGMAAKRANRATDHPSSTIHRGLGVTPGGFTFNESNPLPEDVVIIDEMSMPGVFLTRSFLKAIGPNTRLVLLGDVDQIPSVEPGRVLADIINAKIPSIPVIRLRRIFRQGAQSQIKEAAHLVNSGYLPRLEIEQDSDFFLRTFQPKDDSDEAKAEYREAMAEELVSIAARSVKRGFDPRRDVQVLVPGKRGPLGTEGLNKRLQARLNPNPEDSIQIGEAIWQTGDRVMQIRNAYKRGPVGVFNGDIGFVYAINRDDKVLRVQIDEHLVDYSFTDLDELQLAYASTMHKSQGSEFPFVLLAADWSHFTLLVRNLIYTGMTRAKKLLVMFAHPGALRKAVQTEDTAHRYTLLKYWLQEKG